MRTREASPEGPAVGTRSEQGFVLVWMGAAIFLLLGVAALGVDLVHAYTAGQKLQSAVDAAALGGAIELPKGLDDSLARARVLDLLEENGFDPANVRVDVVENRRNPAIANQVDVEVTYTIDTFFARVLGFDTVTVRKKANAQYDAPVAMGSPANNLGDVPQCPPQFYRGGAIPSPDPRSCLNLPANGAQNLWANVIGSDQHKGSGNARTTRVCVVADTDGCSGAATNDEYVPGDGGVSFNVKNDTGGPVDIWVYDPGFVETGLREYCSKDTAVAWNVAPYDGPANDPLAVYAQMDDQRYCTRDGVYEPGSVSQSAALQTRFEVHLPDGTVPASCTQDFAGFAEDPFAVDPLVRYAPNQVAGVAAAVGTPAGNTRAGFHQWFRLCTVDTPPTAEGHEIRVRVVPGAGRYTNQFSLLALHGDAAPTPQLQTFSRENLPLIAFNATGEPSEFYVARVLPSSKDRILELSFFDLGDSSGTAPRLSPPLPAQPAVNTGAFEVRAAGVDPLFPGFADCTAALPPPNGTASRPVPLDDAWFGSAGPCSYAYDAASATATWDRRWVSIQIRIPAQGPGGWNCDVGSITACWVKIRFDPDGAISDATTWNARFRGSPVRLVG